MEPPPATSPDLPPDPSTWWRDAVTYQLYLRSFADGDGDGIGDLTGIRARLEHLTRLGVDALWLNPWYPSPQADGGYDVADYRDIDPRFGTLDQAHRLITEAHRLGLRVLLDIVPNHTSDEHPWFRKALAEGPGGPSRELFIFRPGRGADGDRPPNDWQSVFGGPAWERVREPDGTAGPWYLHLFHAKQPDLNWRHPQVRAEFLDVLRFWFDAGVDGFRIDVAHGLIKADGLPDLGSTPEVFGEPDRADHPYWDRPEVQAIYQEWRTVADSYDPPRIFAAEAWTYTSDRLAEYLRPGRLHTGFDFQLVGAPWQAQALRRTIEASLAAHRPVNAPVTWVLSNHDILRHVTRLGRDQDLPEVDRLHRAGEHPSDLVLGTRRARAAILLLLALPGAVYLYQGEELGLPEVEDLPEEVLADPAWEQSGHTERGRDGCRVPIPWASDGPSFGFGSGPAWLPQPAGWGALSVQAQDGDPASMLTLYRTALRIRGASRHDGPDGPDGSGSRGLFTGGLTWLELDPQVLAWRRDGGLTCVVNTGADAAPLPPGQVLLASVELGVDGMLPADSAAWLG